jgi:hypothetical protein
MSKVIICKIRITVKDEYCDTPGIMETIRENINYPPLQADYVEDKEIISWQEWRKI